MFEQDKCPNCGDDSIKYKVDEDNELSFEYYWILIAGICQIEISYCPYCGFNLVGENG